MNKMDDLIKALQILRKYGNPEYPTHCEHDILMVVDINPDDVSKEDKRALKKLGFIFGKQFGEDVFYSFKFGSA
jgi:hypothetical protein